MGLYKQYFHITHYVRDQIVKGQSNFKYSLIKKNSRIAIFIIGVCIMIFGIILSSISWMDYIILKNMELRNGSLSFNFWQKPGVARFTKIYIFNVTNPDEFLLSGVKPKLQEVGPFVYREEMEKVNIKFHDNGTVSYQHKKILRFVPELSVDKDEKVTVPNVPLLVLSSLSNSLPYLVQRTISILLSLEGAKPFVQVTAGELVFGYDDTLVKLAHKFYPKRKRPTSKMGLLITRNGTFDEVHNIFTGSSGMQNIGLLDKLNGLDHIPHWEEPPCNSIVGSEGSIFPPPYYTKSDIINIYDKDICRVMPLKNRGSIPTHNGIDAHLYTPVDNLFESASIEPNNKCFCPGNEICPPKGLQSISPCEFDVPIYVSYPHFMDADPSLSEPFEGLQPIKEKHETYLKLQPKLGVPLEAKIRLQINMKIDRAPQISVAKNFPSIIFPVIWLEDGIDEVPETLQKLIYLGTTIADVASYLVTYGTIVVGSCITIGVVVNTYKSLIFTKDTIEFGMRSLKDGAFHLPRPKPFIKRDTYTLLNLNEDTFDDV